MIAGLPNSYVNPSNAVAFEVISGIVNSTSLNKVILTVSKGAL